jgi:phosphodiesterase/alkaline phosphatase D-like protein
MLDTRFDGREALVTDGSAGDAAAAAGRRIMSDEQMAWVGATVQSTAARWKVLANQVPFTDITPVSGDDSKIWADAWAGEYCL